MEFPWIQIHGPIEARRCGGAVFRQPGFPWIQIHGPIEARRNWRWMHLISSCFRGFKSTAPLKLQASMVSRHLMPEFPWIQIHGPIEARR